MKINNVEIDPRKMYVLVKDDISKTDEILLKFRYSTENLGEEKEVGTLYHNQVIIPKHTDNLSYEYRLLRFMDNVIKESESTEKEKNTDKFHINGKILAKCNLIKSHVEYIKVETDELIIDRTAEEFDKKYTFVSLPIKHNICSEFFIETVEEFIIMKKKYDEKQKDRTELVNEITNKSNYEGGFKSVKTHSDNLIKECKTTPPVEWVSFKGINHKHLLSDKQSLIDLKESFSKTVKKEDNHLSFTNDSMNGKVIILPVIDINNVDYDKILENFKLGILTKECYEVIRL